MEARLLVRPSNARRIVRECNTSEWTWVTIFGVSRAAATYGAKYWATCVVALRRPKIDVEIVKGSIVCTTLQRECEECEVQSDEMKLKLKSAQPHAIKNTLSDWSLPKVENFIKIY
jgi:hypothetical protein